jgi:hypothetical protein
MHNMTKLSPTSAYIKLDAMLGIRIVLPSEPDETRAIDLEFRDTGVRATLYDTKACGTEDLDRAVAGERRAVTWAVAEGTVLEWTGGLRVAAFLNDEALMLNAIPGALRLLRNGQPLVDMVFAEPPARGELFMRSVDGAVLVFSGDLTLKAARLGLEDGWKCSEWEDVERTLAQVGVAVRIVGADAALETNKIATPSLSDLIKLVETVTDHVESMPLVSEGAVSVDSAQLRRLEEAAENLAVAIRAKHRDLGSR